MEESVNFSKRPIIARMKGLVQSIKLIGSQQEEEDRRSRIAAMFREGDLSSVRCWDFNSHLYERARVEIMGRPKWTHFRVPSNGRLIADEKYSPLPTNVEEVFNGHLEEPNRLMGLLGHPALLSDLRECCYIEDTVPGHLIIIAHAG